MHWYYLVFLKQTFMISKCFLLIFFNFLTLKIDIQIVCILFEHLVDWILIYLVTPSLNSGIWFSMDFFMMSYKTLYISKLIPEFWNNCNVMQCFRIYLAYYFKLTLTNHEVLMKYWQNIFNQASLLLSYLKALNIAFSASIHWKYSFEESFIGSFVL